MANWFRANAGAFASGSRMRWDRIRDEFVAWRASLNRVENAQLAAGATFRLGQIAHDATVATVRFDLDQAPMPIPLIAPFTIVARLVPVGALRIFRPTTIRYAHVAAAGELGVSSFVPTLNSIPGGTQVSLDAMPTITLSVRLVDRERTTTYAASTARTGGNLWANPFSIVVAGPVNVSERLATDGAGLPDVGLRRLSDLRGLAPLQLPFSQTRFLAGDVLVAVLDVPTLGGAVAPVSRLWEPARRLSLRIEYGMEHGS